MQCVVAALHVVMLVGAGAVGAMQAEAGQAMSTCKMGKRPSKLPEMLFSRLLFWRDMSTSMVSATVSTSSDAVQQGRPQLYFHHVGRLLVVVGAVV